jgi:thiol-disulfide isomerase/thioredoxin
MNLRKLRVAGAVVALLLGGLLAGLWAARWLAPPAPPPVPVAGPPPAVLGTWQPSATAGPALDVDFVDAAGAPVSLAAWRGRVVLVNLWATWCAPCIEEMPALDRVQAKLGGPDFAVVAIAVDRQGERVVRPFFEKLGLAHLVLHLDPANASLRALEARGLPVSVLLDREGRERGRVLGAAAWDGPVFERILRQAIEAR